MFINHDKCTITTYNINNRGNWVLSILEFSVPSSQLSCKFITILKLKVYLKLF